MHPRNAHVLKNVQAQEMLFLLFIFIKSICLGYFSEFKVNLQLVLSNMTNIKIYKLKLLRYLDLYVIVKILSEIKIE